MPTTSRGLYHWLFHSGTSLEDFSDRLNHFWTFGLLLVLGGTISWKYGFQDPITCWTPAEFTSSHVDFAQHICWNTYTYYKPLLLPDIPRLDHYRPVLQYTYFQALPVILCLQALLFKLPHILLHVCHCYSGTSFDKIAGLTDGYENLSLEGRGNLANQIARYIHRWCRMFPHGLPWRWLTVIWFLTKCLFCINIIIQLTYIDRFLQVNEEQQYIKNETLTSYGDVIYDNIAKNNGSFWRESPVFPRMILCDFQVPMFRNVHMYTVQCALNVNNFTEHAYMFLWVWLLFVAIVTILSCAVWTIRTLLPFGRQRYVKRLLQTSGDSGEGTKPPGQQHEVAKLSGLLGEDGVMVLKLIADNSSELFVKDVIRDISILEQSGTGRLTGNGGQIIQPAPSHA